MDNLIVVIAHAPLASALRQCVAHVFPERIQGVLALDIQADDAPEQSLQVARQALQTHGKPTLLVLTDILGATPCNLARQLIQDLPGQPAAVLSGVNLPMLMRAVTYQTEPLPALMERAMAGGQQGVLQVEFKS